MPSDTETLGFVVLEALASGIPVVGVAAGGLLDIIENNSTGFLAENNEDMCDFSEKVDKLVNNRELLKAFSNNAIEYAMRWSWKAATEKLRNSQYRKAIILHRLRSNNGGVTKDIEQAIINKL